MEKFRKCLSLLVLLIAINSLVLYAESGDPVRPTVTGSSFNIKDLQLRGRIHSQFGYTQVKNAHADENWSTVELRRVRMGMQGTLFQNVRARIEANLLPNDNKELTMRSAYLQWREYKPAYIKVGLDKPTFVYEENTSSSEILTVERSMITNLTIPKVQNGITVDGTTGMFFYSAGVYTNKSNTNTADEEARYLHGLSAGLNFKELMSGSDQITIRADFLSNDASGGDFKFKEGLAVSMHYDGKPFDLRIEAVEVKSFGEAKDKTQGWYVMPSYFVSEKFQLVARYEVATSDAPEGIQAADRYARRAPNLGAVSGDTRGDDYQAIYLGGTYYLAKHDHKLMAGVEQSTLKTEAADDLEATTLYAAWRMLF